MKTLKQRGFTIIEVVLVLAIAGLIFLVVFLAVPALQTSQRDTQRRSDLSRLQTSIENYRSNNKGTLPFTSAATITAFLNSYLRSSGETFDSPGGNQYVLTLTAATPAAPFTTAFSSGIENTIYYKTGVKCGTTGEGSLTAGGTRDYALIMPQEGGGIACQNN